MLWGAWVAAWCVSCREPAAVADARCTLRVAARGISVDGDPMTPEQAIAACKRTSGAMAIIADDAPPTVWPALRKQLARAHVTIHMRGAIDDRGAPGGRWCMNNPLAKGCD
jgi:hypothetical protein